MKRKQKDILEILPMAISSLKKNILSSLFGDNWNSQYADEKPPLRAELYTEDQLENHAQLLAQNHVLIEDKPSEPVLKRFAENEHILSDVHRLLTASVKENNRIVPAAEWLLDNFYLIEEHIYVNKKHLPKGYSKGLPQLAKGQSAGLPRVYDIAVEIISHTDGRVDLKILSGFIKAYQTKKTLKLGELWAIPIMLRLALIENLRRLAVQIAIDIHYKDLANYWADEMTKSVEENPKNLVLIIADMARSEPPMVSSFIAEFTRRLQEKGTTLTLPLNWIEQQLSENGLSSAQLVHEENQKQANDQVSISNSINSLRFLGTNDWKEFVEDTSTIESILKQDPNGVYGKMDFYTRDTYRHVIEQIAKHSTWDEDAIAQKAVDLAKENAERNPFDSRMAHVGYFLEDKGLGQLERTSGMKRSVILRLRRMFRKITLLYYIGGISILTAIACRGLFYKAYQDGLRGWLLILLTIVCVTGVSQLMMSIINWLSTLLVTPRLLPRMDFSKRIADDCKTLVVVPTILSSIKNIDSLVEGLEVRFLANRNENLYFGLLTDFKDAKEERMPEDELLEDCAKEKIIALNKKYGRVKDDTFFLFHRPRRWNATEKIWMGFERKRGKLSDLNELLRGSGKDHFSIIIGEKEIFTTIKYVITLDTDTQLARDTAWKMIGTMAHPLNHPLYSEKKLRVIKGYTILQPRVANSLPAGNSSLYAKICSNERGTDPYTRAISDVYQDLFGEGSFIGKGIYDIDMFEKVLKKRFPDNRILSHDLLEGCYSRSGLISDVQLYEEYPSQYSEDMKRRRRWIRGDWQIARWVLPFVPGHDKHFQKNPLSILSRWKIFDNLRRSLVQFSLLLILLFGWLLSPSPHFWTSIVIIILFFPSLLTLCWELFKKPADEAFLQHVAYSVRYAVNNFVRQIIDMICLPYEALENAGTVLLTLWRVFITHRKLLEWNPFENASTRNRNTFFQTYKTMWVSTLFSLVLFFFLLIHSPFAFSIAILLLILWIAAPFFTWSISIPSVTKKVEFSNEQSDFLYKIARKTWGFFERFVIEEDNWLPPDNYQEEPVERIAHRTSPTNIGLSLLANLAAYDFGYITVTQLTERTTNAINTLLKMEKYQGHFFNWYDTLTLTPLHPRYISTVDSGNLAGDFITLKQGLLSLEYSKIVSDRVYAGLLDTVHILAEKLKDNKPLKSFELMIITMNQSSAKHLPQIIENINSLETSFTTIAAMFPREEEISWWSDRLLVQIKNIHSEIISLVPLLSVPEAPEKYKEHILKYLPAIPTLKELARIKTILSEAIEADEITKDTAEETEWLATFNATLEETANRARELIFATEQLSNHCAELSVLEYDFLFDESQDLLSIGFNVDEHRRDNSFYDLLASEARLSIFIGIAQGKLPQNSWFALRRQLTSHGSMPVLLSWSGSMFEYLMPLLIMPTYENTLLDETNKAVVQKQIEYGAKHSVPWGISESGYNMVDSSLNYQYRAFGVPGLGFKRGLGEDLVVSPYSTVMALMVAPEESYRNLRVLKEDGFEGNYGFYEAIDYTPARLPRRQTNVIIRSYMAHHQGMGFLSLAYLLLDKPMQKRFESDVEIKATLLLLQERIPKVTTYYSPNVHVADTSVVAASNMSMRVINTPNTPIPEVQFLSNGNYHVMVTNAGGGYSRWKDIAVTRWREDATCDNRGTFCFIRDLDNDTFWSSAYQPSLQTGEHYEAVFSQSRAEFRRRDFSLETHTEIVVSPEDDIELRRVHIVNRSRKRRSIEVTSYAEVVLNNAMADELHPAFNNLFVQTEINPQRNAIICTRRPRSEKDRHPSMFHLMKVHDAEIKDISYETDRSQFIGRSNTIHNPAAMNQDEPLKGNQGSVLDPIISIQYRIVIEPYQSVTIDMIYGIGETREICNGLIDKYQEIYITKRVLELAWTHSQVILRQINATEADAELYARLAGSIIFPNASMRTDASNIIKNRRGQSGLWAYSISGDLPIVLLQIEDSSNIDLVKQLVQAHAYWRLKGLMVDLVIWNDDHGGYRQVLQNQIIGLISPGSITDIKDQPGGIFIRSSDQISNEDRILFQAVAHIVISDSLGTLEEQVNRRNKLKVMLPYLNATRSIIPANTIVEPYTDLQFDNKTGGFSNNGKEYIIHIDPIKTTPAPWINMLANPNFGSIITESGQSYTWVENAHELRLTPWNNDPVTGLQGEAFYLRDEETGRFWSPTPQPCRGKSNYVSRHGFGYTVFQHSEDGIYSEITMYVDIEAPIKFISIKLQNRSDRTRRLSATGYIEWILGDLRSKTSMHIITEKDTSSGTIYARNAYNSSFENRVAFFDADDGNKTFTTDRTEFIGRNGTLRSPDALKRTKLSGRIGAAYDPCAAIQTVIELSQGDEREIVFKLGAGRDMDDAIAITKRFEGITAARNALEKVKQYWNHTLSAVVLQTPDASVNLLANGWLNYQTLACRIWARSGFYQSGGAFGFRDQLQDVLSLLHTQPAIAREQILLSAAQQFKEGDVQHWWHPPANRGVRTTCSDDYLWLPFVTYRYVALTGDKSILDESIYFIEGRLLNIGEESHYDLPIKSDTTATLYEHCKKAIEFGSKVGVHGLPLMGSGDWNDGMDKVGEDGKGESVWLAFFLYDILVNFGAIAQSKNDLSFAEKTKQQAQDLKKNVDANAWDGEWYRRAYFDDGTPLGSSQNKECKIDSIAQSWSVLTNGGENQHTITAMESAYKNLVRKDDGIIQLFDPPFDKSSLNPGYIKGYVPGVRENGGQYTHAAVWLIMGFAALKQKERTWELLQMINPINRSNNAEKMAIYKVEPYVMAADVYAEPLHKGMGGWTWYTGSAGWMYQLMLESFIGLKRRADTISFEPCIPTEWASMRIDYRYEETMYHIEYIQNHNSEFKIVVDGAEQTINLIHLLNDRRDHEIKVYL
jgi:cyclic beta-1,2-glucan synthetase